MRKATIRRKTAETEISVAIGLDGKGEGRIDTSIPFLDHMLNLFARHSLTDLEVRGRGRHCGRRSSPCGGFGDLSGAGRPEGPRGEKRDRPIRLGMGPDG